MNSPNFRIDNEIKEPWISLKNNTKSYKNLDLSRKLRKTNLRGNQNTGKKDSGKIKEEAIEREINNSNLEKGEAHIRNENDRNNKNCDIRSQREKQWIVYILGDSIVAFHMHSSHYWILLSGQTILATIFAMKSNQVLRSF